jgi:serine acetyltransferase
MANRGNPKAAMIVLWFRLASWARSALPGPLSLPFTLSYQAVCAFLLGVEIPVGTSVGPGLRINHPHAIVVHPDTVIGANCRLNQCVTIGQRGDSPDAPRLGDNVSVGSGGLVLGPITLGDGATVGAGAVVVTDVPAGHVAVGPAATVRAHS